MLDNISTSLLDQVDVQLGEEIELLEMQVQQNLLQKFDEILQEEQ